MATRHLEIAYASMKGRGASSLPHVADADPVRIITDEELEAVWSDKKPAKAALDTAVARGNVVLNAKPALKKAQPFYNEAAAAALDCPSRRRFAGPGKYPGGIRRPPAWAIGPSNSTSCCRLTDAFPDSR